MNVYSEVVLEAAVQEVIEYFRTMTTNRAKAERLAVKAFTTAINAAAMVEVHTP